MPYYFLLISFCSLPLAYCSPSRVVGPATGPSREGGGTCIHGDQLFSSPTAEARSFPYGKRGSDRSCFSRPRAIHSWANDPMGVQWHPMNEFGVVFAVILDMNGINGTVGRIGAGGPAAPLDLS